tara:strand:- start:130 stop:507 length:378 start_codon:yes stop_codon:yes gene_type:complete
MLKIIVFTSIIMFDLREILTTLKEKIGDMEINADNITKVLKFAMECVEVTELKGEAKKDLAIKLVRQVVEEAPISDEKEKLLLDMIDQKVLHGMVDLVVEAKEGKIDINALKQVGTGCCNIFKKN